MRVTMPPRWRHPQCAHCGSTSVWTWLKRGRSRNIVSWDGLLLPCCALGSYIPWDLTCPGVLHALRLEVPCGLTCPGVLHALGLEVPWGWKCSGVLYTLGSEVGCPWVWHAPGSEVFCPGFLHVLRLEVSWVLTCPGEAQIIQDFLLC